MPRLRIWLIQCIRKEASMLNKEFKDFDCKRFEEEVFQNNQPDPFHKRWQNIRSWGDVRNHFGLSSLRCDEWQLRQGYMSAPLHEALERTLGKERLASYFPPEPERPKLSKEEQEMEDMATMLWGSVADVSAMRNRKK